MSLIVTPLDNVGVEVSGFDINGPYSEALQAELKALWYEHAILLFRDQQITPQSQIRFSRLFGKLEMHPLKVTTSEQYPELFVLENNGAKDRFTTAFYHGEEIVGRLDWHIDLHYTGRPNHGVDDAHRGPHLHQRHQPLHRGNGHQQDGQRGLRLPHQTQHARRAAQHTHCLARRAEPLQHPGHSGHGPLGRAGCAGHGVPLLRAVAV